MVKPINAVYAMHSINGLAGSFIGIFIPIYLLQLGNSLSSVFIYYLVYAVAILLFFFIAGMVANKIGIKKTILLSYLFLFVYLWLLYNLDKGWISIYMVAIVYGVHVAFYWFAMHIVVICHSNAPSVIYS